MNLRTAKRLHDAKVAAERILTFTSGRTLEAFLADVYFQSAVERQFEVLAEALRGAENLSPELRDDFPELSQIIGLRNRIAHSYDNLDYTTLWETATDDIPALLPRIELVLDRFVLPDDFYD